MSVNLKNKDVATRIEKAYLDLISKYNTVGTSVCLLDKDDNRHFITSGLSSIENNTATKKEDIYRIASISKVVVAIGVLMLYDKGLVDLDEDISKYLGYSVINPNYKDKNITLRMVMSQTASFRDSYGYDKSNSTDDYIELQDILQEKNGYKVFSENEPGCIFEYSNLGCGVLACVIEKVTNTYFPDYIVNELLKKLDIYSGFRLENLKYKENLVSHYLYDASDDKFILYRDYDRFKKYINEEYQIYLNNK